MEKQLKGCYTNSNMYDDFETKTSYKYLQTVVQALQEPVCLLGGWAVYFLVNTRFREEQGKDYLGSRDIDLGFHIGENWDEQQLKTSAFAQALTVLEHELGFKSVMFRLVKEIHTETGKELQPDNYVFPHQRFAMSVDPIVDFVPQNFYTLFRLHPIQVPLLKFAFESPFCKLEQEGLGKKLLLPRPELILAMKIWSMPERDKRDKKIKDLCDMFSLLWYTGDTPANLKNKARLFLPENKMSESLSAITPEDLHNASIPLNHSAEEIEKVLFA